MLNKEYTEPAAYKQALADLAGRISHLHEHLESNALDRALDIGDMVIEALEIFQAGGKIRAQSNCKGWLQKNCPALGVSTAFLYVRLSRHRKQIEVARLDRPGLSIRDARNLLTKSRPKASPTPTSMAATHTVTNGEPSKTEPVPEPEPVEESTPAKVAVSVKMALPALIAAWQVASIEKRRAFLAQVGEQDLRAALPDTIRAAWEAHFRNNAGLHERATKKAERQIKKFVRERSGEKKAERDERLRKAAAAHRLYTAPAASESRN
jgi:hypothetical protein